MSDPTSASMPSTLEEKAAVMREFRRVRMAGLPVPPDLYARHLHATNDGYKTGPDPGQRIPDFSLPDQDGRPRDLANLTGTNGLFLVFHRSASW